MLLRSKVK